MNNTISMGLIITVLAGILFFTLGCGSAPTSNSGDPFPINRASAAGKFEDLEPHQIKDAVLRRAEELANSKELPDDLGYPKTWSGFISYAWQLPQTPELLRTLDWNGYVRRNYAVEIPIYMLQGGDILTNLRAGDHGHALLFVEWELPDPGDLRPDEQFQEWSSQTSAQDAEDRMREQFTQGMRFVAYEMSRVDNPPQIVRRAYTLQIIDGALTIKELDAVVRGPYHAERYNQIKGYAEQLGKIELSRLRVGQPIVAQFTIVNRGGQSLALRRLGAVALGPGWDVKGISAPQTKFPPVDLVLQPGEMKTYTQTQIFNNPGVYSFMVTYEIDGEPFTPAIGLVQEIK